MTYFCARFGVLGVYVTGRTREKQADATGELPPTVLGELLKVLANRRSDRPFIRYSAADF
jgi:hypothetical protein